MFWRLFSFAFFQLSAALLSCFVVSADNRLVVTLCSAVVAGYVWLLIDATRGARLLRWLQVGDTTDAPLGAGMWGEVFERVRKLLRARDRLKVESELRLQDFLAALQASPSGVVLLDSKARIEWFNQTASAHFGIEPSRDILQHFGNLVRDPGFANYFALRDFKNDVLIPGRDNTLSKPVKLSVHLHPYGEGRILMLSRDITEKEQADAMRRDFVANVSHEIRTPLTVLIGFVETMQSLPLSEDQRRHYLDLMSQQSQRMQTLVNDLLMLSRLEGSPLPPIHDWVNVRQLLSQCRQEALDLSGLLWKQPQHIEFDIQGDCEVAGSDAELHSAFTNLISNAVRYTPADRRITVSWNMLPQGGAVFAVKDNGHGIAPEHVPRLTERFYRVDRSRSRDTGGTGLGLAIVKHVAQRHSAELSIDSVPGKGSVFSISFAPKRIRSMLASDLQRVH